MSDICSKCGFDMDAQFEARARLIDKYEKGCANLESELAHLRQENAELKAESLGYKTAWKATTNDLNSKIQDLQRHKNELEYWISKCALHKAALEKCREALEDCHGYVVGKRTWIKLGVIAKAIDAATSALDTTQPTQDPTTSIAYGLYPSSARPVNPNPSKSENWVGYTPIDPQSK